MEIKDLKYNKLNIRLIIGIALILLVSTPVVINIFWQPYDSNAMDYDTLLAAPSLDHIFGTDNCGRDIYSRVVDGAGLTFGISVVTVLIGALIGTLVGAITGYYGGVIDEILMRINDCLASFPSILLALVIVSILDMGTLNVCIALGLVFIPSFARVMRAEFIAQRDKDYVLNAKLMGAGSLRIIFLHIFPNTLQIFFSTILVAFNNAVLAEAGLSFLGLGVQPPDASLGRMLSESKVYIFSAPWYVGFTCLYIVTALLGVSIFSENIGVSGINLKKVKRKVSELILANSDNEQKPDTDCLLEVRNLQVGFIENYGIDETIKGISFKLEKGEILGIVGESGSGKSLTSFSVLGIIPDKAVMTGGNVYYRGKSLNMSGSRDNCRMRGGKIAMIFQEPQTSLNPVFTIGRQLDEMLDLHAAQLSEEEHTKKVLEALEDVGLADGVNLCKKYPHELSGGMRQRVMIAMALVSGAEIIIADEPTTALDADVSDSILEIFREINQKYGTSIILISHDLKVIEKICSRLLIMQDGKILEEVGVDNGEFDLPVTAYGKGLLGAAYCTKRYNKVLNPDIYKHNDTIVELSKVNVFYPAKATSLASKKKLTQVNFDINLKIMRGATLGIAGPSGCGKSTLVKAIAGLQKYVTGDIVRKCELPGMVFQDPQSSLNPNKSVGWILEEPLRINTKLNATERRQSVIDMLNDIGLGEEYVTRKISELSGGQKQRVSIALALMLNRKLIILDEPVSAVDVTLREQLLELLDELKRKHGLTYILISHDEELLARFCTEVVRMREGRLTEG